MTTVETAVQEPKLSRMSESYIRAASEVIDLIGEIEEWSESLDWGERLKNDGILTSKALIKAFKAVRRYDFLPDEIKP
jgi:hypothetical protein